MAKRTLESTANEIIARNKMMGENFKIPDAMHLAALFAQARPQEPAFRAAIDAELLSRIGRQLNALACGECNNGSTDRSERRRERLGQKARLIASWYGLTAEYYGDPRGYVLRLIGPGLASNSMGDGFGVA